MKIYSTVPKLFHADRRTDIAKIDLTGQLLQVFVTNAPTRGLHFSLNVSHFETKVSPNSVK
jgi:hypothetical protein